MSPDRLPALNKLLKFGALTSQSRRTLVAAWTLMPLFWFGLRFLGLTRMQAWIGRRKRPLAAMADADRVAETSRMVAIATHYAPFPVTCLTRSLLLQWLLARAGAESELRLGVSLAASQLSAHAWVEFGGVPINDVPDVAHRYAAFDSATLKP